ARPARPVVAPKKTTRRPGPLAFAERSRPASRSPTHIALTRQFEAYAGSKTVCPPKGGTPQELRGSKAGRPANGRNATAFAIVSDPRHDLLEVEVGLAEPEPVEEGNRP